MTPLRIALRLPWLNDGTKQNHIGDHDVAESWAKYLRRRPDVREVNIFGERVYADAIAGHDVVIHYWPWSAPVPGAKNVLYLQSALSAKDFGVDTVGVFQQVKGRFDGYMFVSETLRERCGADGAVVPFGSDPEVYHYCPSDKYADVAVCFVGNDIRPAEVNERYLIPAIPHGLVIYGGPFHDPRLQAVHRGRLPAADLPMLYSSARVNLNLTHPEHAKNGTVNQRVYDVLACGGLLISDYVPAMEDGNFDIHMSFVGRCDSSVEEHMKYWGNAELVERAHPMRLIDERRNFILSRHTVAHRVADVMAYLKGIL